MKTLTVAANGLLMLLSSALLPAVGRPTAAEDFYATRLLSSAQSAVRVGSAQGGDVSPISNRECEVGLSCTKKARLGPGGTCPDQYFAAAATGCTVRSCVMMCDSAAHNGLCVGPIGDCRDTSRDAGPPESCGNGIKGHCYYTQLQTSILGVIYCRAGSLCYWSGETVWCGIVRKCETR